MMRNSDSRVSTSSAGLHRRSVDLDTKIHRPTAVPRPRLDAEALLRLVAEVDPDRRYEDKGEDQRDHHVVMDAAAWISPPEIAPKSLSELAHRCIKSRVIDRTKCKEGADRQTCNAPYRGGSGTLLSKQERASAPLSGTEALLA